MNFFIKNSKRSMKSADNGSSIQLKSKFNCVKLSKSSSNVLNDCSADSVLGSQSTSIKFNEMTDGRPCPPPRQRIRRKKDDAPLPPGLQGHRNEINKTEKTTPKTTFNDMNINYEEQKIVQVEGEENNEKHDIESKSQSILRKENQDKKSFFTEELFENLMHHMKVMDEINDKLKYDCMKYQNELRKIQEKLNESYNDNIVLLNELEAVKVERDQLLVDCKRLDQLKENEWTCSICMDERNLIQSQGKQIVSTQCGHIFCDFCLKMSLGIESVCPACRTSILYNGTTASYHNLYF